MIQLKRKFLKQYKNRCYKKTYDAIMKKASDILAAKMIPRSPKNNFSKKQTIVLILKKTGP